MQHSSGRDVNEVVQAMVTRGRRKREVGGKRQDPAVSANQYLMACDLLRTEVHLPLPLRVDSAPSGPAEFDTACHGHRLAAEPSSCGNALARATRSGRKMKQMVGGRSGIREELDRRKERNKAAIAPQQSMNRARIELRSLVKRALIELAHNTPPCATTSRAEFAN